MENLSNQNHFEMMFKKAKNSIYSSAPPPPQL